MQREGYQSYVYELFSRTQVQQETSANRNQLLRRFFTSKKYNFRFRGSLTLKGRHSVHIVFTVQTTALVIFYKIAAEKSVVGTCAKYLYHQIFK